MDWILVSALNNHAQDLEELRVSYDIACTYSRRFLARMSRYDKACEFDFSNRTIKWAVPKFHLHAHGPSCRSNYSWNYMPGAGRTHGEIIETGWATLNPAAVATREMSGDSRREVLEDVMGAVNWGKITRNGPFLSVL